MNRILAICHSLSPEGLKGMNVFLRPLVQVVTMKKPTSIHFFDGLPFSVMIFLPIPIYRIDSTKIR